MDIKLVKDEDFMQLAELTVAMYAEMKGDINAFQAINMLMFLVNKGQDFTVIGLYNDLTLMGFIAGSAETAKVFSFSGMYMVDKNTSDTKKMIDFALNLVEERGYNAWEFDSSNDNIVSIMSKYGAEPVYTRYRKEINNG